MVSPTDGSSGGTSSATASSNIGGREAKSSLYSATPPTPFSADSRGQKENKKQKAKKLNFCSSA